MRGQPHKIGLDYFYFDIDFFKDEKIKLLKEVTGDSGVIICLNFFCFAFKNSYFFTWDRKSKIAFREEYNLTQEIADSILLTMLDIEIIDKELFDDYGIITSEFIQQAYIKIISRSHRNYCFFTKEYLLVKPHLLKPKYFAVKDIKGNIITDFITKKVKRIKPETVEIPFEKPAPPPPAPEDNFFKSYSMMEFISVPYKLRPDKFKESYSEREYEGYIELSKIISDEPNLKECYFQLTLPEYRKLFKEVNVSREQVIEAIGKMANYGIEERQTIYRRLRVAIGWVKEDAAKKGTGLNGKVLYPQLEAVNKKALLGDYTKKGGL